MILSVKFFEGYVCKILLLLISGTQALGATVPADIAQHKMKDPVDFSRKKLKSAKKKKELKVLRMYVASSITISAICVPYTLRG